MTTVNTVHSPEVFFGGAVDNNEKTGTDGSRIYTYLQSMGDGLSTLFTSTNALYKLAKLGNALSLGVMVAAKNPNLPVASALASSCSETSELISGIGVVERLNVFSSGAYRKKSVWKVISTASLVISKTAESMKWLAKRGVINLGNMARALGGTTLYNATQRVAITTVKNTFVVIASAASIVDAILAVAKDSAKSVRASLSIVEDTGKIVLTCSSRYWFTAPFVAAAAITSIAGLSKVLYDAYN